MIDMQKITRQIVRRIWPVRSAQSHKGDYGTVLVVAGSRTMCGAGYLCAKSALKAGAGLVYWALPQSMQPSFAAALPEVITLPLPETKNGEMSKKAWPILDNFIKKMRPSVLAVGPGMGPSPLLKILLTKTNLPLILDADGLNALAANPTISFKGPAILTPHPGEIARLLKCPVPTVEQERWRQVEQLVHRTESVCVLKGSGTLVAYLQSNGNVRVWQNTTGGPALAKAGSGDVLTGMIAGLWAQLGKKDGFTATTALRASLDAVYAHGLAGDLAEQALDPHSVLATDTVSFIPWAFKQILSKEK